MVVRALAAPVGVMTMAERGLPQSNAASDTGESRSRPIRGVHPKVRWR